MSRKQIELAAERMTQLALAALANEEEHQGYQGVDPARKTAADIARKWLARELVAGTHKARPRKVAGEWESFMGNLMSLEDRRGEG